MHKGRSTTFGPLLRNRSETDDPAPPLRRRTLRSDIKSMAAGAPAFFEAILTTGRGNVSSEYEPVRLSAASEPLEHAEIMRLAPAPFKRLIVSGTSG